MLKADNPYRHDAGPLQGVWQWTDPRFGIVRQVSGTYLIPPNPRWWIYTCELARAPVGTWHSLNDFSSAGCSIDPDEALRCAFGEAVERYCGLSELEQQIAVRPMDNSFNRKLPLCARDEPCPAAFKRWDLRTPVTHAPMRSLNGGSTVLVPAPYVSLSFTPAEHEPMITLPISTGLAFHPDLCTAIWKGLCEVIERDAMMLMWWTRRAAREITQDSALPERVADRLRRLEFVGLKGHLFDITTDLRVPAVFSVVCGERYPFFSVGAACNDDPAAACAKALDEAVSVRVSLRFEKWAMDVPSLENFDWVRGLEHHMILYAGWRDAPALDFLLHGDGAPLSFGEFAGQPRRRPPAGMADLTRLAAELEAEGLDVLWADLTSADAAGLGSTVKVFVPQMMPLSQDHRARWLNTPRLLRAAGLKTATCAAFNPFPHPFA